MYSPTNFRCLSFRLSPSGESLSSAMDFLAIHFAKDFQLFHHEEDIGAIETNLASRVLAEQNAVRRFQAKRCHLALVIDTAFAHGYHNPAAHLLGFTGYDDRSR